jgi:hypothetical protein
MKFIIPKCNVEYRLLEDVKINLSRFDAINRTLLKTAHGGSYTVTATLNSGTIVKFPIWKVGHCLKIRIVTTGDKKFQSLCGYLTQTTGMDFLENTEFELI